MDETYRFRTEEILKVGESVDLELETPEGVKSYKARVERVRDDLLMFILPNEFADLIEHGASTPITISKTTANSVFVLSAKFAYGRKADVPVVTLSKVGEWQRVQRRQDVRLRISIDPLKTTLIAGKGESPVRAMILDVSAGGLLIQSRDPLPDKARLRVDFQLQGGAMSVETEVEARWLADHQEDNWRYYRAGVQFVALKPRDRKRIASFILQEQARRRKIVE